MTTTTARLLRKTIISASLSLLALSASFNTAAHPSEDLPLPSTEKTSEAAQKQFQLDYALSREVASLGQFLHEKKKTNPTYTPQNDAHIRGNIKAIKKLIDDGANVNHNTYSSLMIADEAYSTAFTACFKVSQLLQSTELLDHMLAHGADVNFKGIDGRGPMDHALNGVIDAQDQSIDQLRFNLILMKRLMDRGVPLSDAKEILAHQAGDKITDVIHNVVGIDEFYTAGLIDEETRNRLHYGSEAAIGVISTTDHITPDLLRAFGAKILDFSATVPKHPFAYTVRANDTLSALANRFATIMGTTTTQDGRTLIAQQNDGVKNLRIGQIIHIPVAVGREIHTKLVDDLAYFNADKKTTSFEKIAKQMGAGYYRPDAKPAEIAAELARINGMDINAPLTADDTIIVPYLYDSHKHLDALKPGPTARNKRIDLIVAERAAGDTGEHHMDTFRTATGTAFAINPAVDFKNFHALDESVLYFMGGETSDGIRALFSNATTQLTDNVVFTHSMSVTRSAKIADQKGQAHTPDTLLYRATNMAVDALNTSRPIVFQAAGNGWYSGEGRYIQPYGTTHSPRAVIVGSSGMYKTKDSKDTPLHVMSSYSGFGGDICTKQPNRRGEQMSGTSFSTPETAALYRQMAAWYGDQLNFEEIMAAAMMTASRDVRDFENVGSYQSIFGSPTEDTLQSAPAEFVTNGGGLPHHDRCGPGILNVPAWHNAIQTMLDLKATGGHTATDITATVTVQATRINVGYTKLPEYEYRVRVPQDMTLGKLTFKFPQYAGAHGEIAVRTPAGFDLQMPKSFSQIVSTFAFAYEDVKRGDVFTIRTTQPLAPEAGIVLRGHKPGSSIAALRDHLRAAGTLPAPLKSVVGDKATDFTYPVNLHQALPIPPTPIYPERNR
ncbi:LysM peptidoglycan-binding domain-containing protein [Micavibrio aeruginosavorus]|uniref:LysM peptidoglycan-binding domain-containing protein n=1 Tax=Micavibrio aeruginosavorus TaxID=349221 RepID=UPI003F4A92F2